MDVGALEQQPRLRARAGSAPRAESGVGGRRGTRRAAGCREALPAGSSIACAGSLVVARRAARQRSRQLGRCARRRRRSRASCSSESSGGISRSGGISPPPPSSAEVALGHVAEDHQRRLGVVERRRPTRRARRCASCQRLLGVRAHASRARSRTPRQFSVRVLVVRARRDEHARGSAPATRDRVRSRSRRRALISARRAVERPGRGSTTSWMCALGRLDQVAVRVGVVALDDDAGRPRALACSRPSAVAPGATPSASPGLAVTISHSSRSVNCAAETPLVERGRRASARRARAWCPTAPSPSRARSGAPCASARRDVGGHVVEPEVRERRPDERRALGPARSRRSPCLPRARSPRR